VPILGEAVNDSWKTALSAFSFAFRFATEPGATSRQPNAADDRGIKGIYPE
jgi:hypothetical protein